MKSLVIWRLLKSLLLGNQLILCLKSPSSNTLHGVENLHARILKILAIDWNCGKELAEMKYLKIGKCSHLAAYHGSNKK